MIPPQIQALCRNGSSVTAELVKNPSEEPGKAAKRLFGHDFEEEVTGERIKDPKRDSEQEDLQQAFECGNWGTTRPSNLFLKIYHDVLCTLEKNPLIGVCSPSLLGSSGVLPLTIISTIPDICRHMSNVIARAEREVYLATNFWMHSEPASLISNSLRELSRRAGERGHKVVVKVIYDRGNAKQFIKNHQPVPESTFADPEGPIRLPNPAEIENLELEVVNYHRPIFGTFHCKYMIVDRKIAIIQSNNIQDNDNCEFMSQIEGPIVDSFYDMALISWHNQMKPPLACLNTPAVNAGFPTFESKSHSTQFDEKGNHVPVYQQANPMPNGTENQQQIAEKGSHIHLPQHTPSNPNYDSDIAGEVLRAVSFLNPREGERRIDGVTRVLNTTIQHDTKASCPEVAISDQMTPLIPIPPHDPFPMAMVCRRPWGSPTKNGVYTPQNEAWLATLRNAEHDVFIQTPNLNAEALLPEILAACRRGVHVKYYYCLGYNDAGELLPGQGGTNEMIANHFFTTLEPEFHKNLDIYAYVAKDQIHPIHNKFKKRSCHIKIMIADGHIGIQGNGNQDTQSYYHSQEINILLDSSLICSKWTEGLRQNQNTHIYGAVQKSGADAGCWQDPETGKQAEGAIGVDPGKFSWAKGVVGAVQRVRGAGGF